MSDRPVHSVRLTATNGANITSHHQQHPQVETTKEGNGMKRRALIAAALVVAVAASLAATAGAGSQAVARAGATSCKGTIKFGNMTVFSGPAAFLGQDQGSWANLAATNMSKFLKMKFRIVNFDTTLDPSVAATAAQKLVGDESILGTVGPATSGGVAATSKTLADAKVTHVTPSATRATLTKGPSPEASNFFFRVVGDDSIQGTVAARHIIDKMKAKKVTVFDAQEPYSVGLANIAEAVLKRAGVTVQRQSVTNNTTDLSSNVTRIPSDTDVVYMPLQIASQGQQVAVLLREQGKKAIVFGADGFADPAFKFPGSLVTVFAPDISVDPGRKALVEQWKKANPGRTFSSFGPPAYGAVQALAYAAKRACAKKTSITRSDIRLKIKQGLIPNFVLTGQPFRFSTKTNDPLNAAFWLYEVQSDGSQKQVGRLPLP
jgi:branched-chain amino acid transport system substrate-binding protein